MKTCFGKIVIIGLAILGVAWLVLCDSDHSSNLPVVAITQIVEHPALDATYRGIVDELKSADCAHSKTIEIVFECAQGSPLLASQIAQKFVGNKPDVIVGIGTTSAQTLRVANDDSGIPIVFSSVTDPRSAQLVDNYEAPEGVTTGVSNWIAIKPQIEVIKEIVPRIKAIGVIYNPGEANSETLVGIIRDVAQEYNIKLVKASASDSSEVGQAAQSLIGKVDAIFISNDNTALSAFESVVKAGEDGDIPVFVSDTDMIERGAVAALGPNQYDIGRQTGEQVLKILKGIEIEAIPVELPRSSDLHINLQASQNIDLIIDPSIIKQSKRTIK